MIDAFVPPKAERVGQNGPHLAFLRLVGNQIDPLTQLSDGLSRLSVGGTMPWFMARIEKIASTAPAAPRQCPTADFVDDIEIFLRGIAEQPR